MRFLPSGGDAILVEFDTPADRRAFVDAVGERALPGVAEVVPAAVTVQLLCDGSVALADVVAAARGVEPLVDKAPAGDELVLPVRYDGPDLEQVAALLGIGVDEVVARHTGQVWTCDFLGFLPGFGYLTGEHDDLVVPRRQTPRTRVPAGSVGLAGAVSGVYPASSPGGWQLIGTCDVPLFDVDRDPPALLAPGTRVRFEVAS